LVERQIRVSVATSSTVTHSWSQSFEFDAHLQLHFFLLCTMCL